jgi:transposase-like protein
MARKRFSSEEIIGKLRAAEVGLAQGRSVALMCKGLGIAEQTFYRWRREYGGLRIDQVKRLKQVELENTRLRRAVADLTVDNQILKEAAQGKW